jgi:hypothetical protein
MKPSFDLIFKHYKIVSVIIKLTTSCCLSFSWKAIFYIDIEMSQVKFQN